MSAVRDRAVGSFQFGDWLVRPDHCRIERGDEQVLLEPRQMDVLVCLAEHDGEVVSADQLLVECWHGTFYGDNPVHKAIALLRKALGDSPQPPRYIATIRKRGYRVLVPVSFAEAWSQGEPPDRLAWTGGSPYRGLESFDERHAAVYFGRGRAVADLLGMLRARRAAECAFLLLVGPSGSGKTSLVYAGLLPMLTQPGGFDGMRIRAIACLDAKASGTGILRSLAQALGQWRVDEVPLFPDAHEPALLGTLEHAPERIVERIAPALDRAADEGEAVPQLLLIVDQLEGIFGDSGPAECAAAIRVLDVLARSGRVIVLATCRSDFYAPLVALPGLLDLKEAGGHYDVHPPSPGEVAQMIRRPARAAGLSFDHDPDTQSYLDDVLRDAAMQTPGSLPLLQHVLQELYERRDAEGHLTFAAYRELGGLEGGLSRHAERVYSELPRPAQDALFRVLQALVVMPEAEEAVIARRAPLAGFTDPHERELIAHFVDARLFVSEQQDGEPMLSVAHEALLRHWLRAREWTERNIELLRTRTRLTEYARRWRAEGERRDLLLSSGRLLDEARPLLGPSGLSLEPDETAFLRASIRRARRFQWLRASAIVTIVLLAIGASGAAWMARRAQQRAEQHRAQAENLIGFMLDDLSRKLQPIARLDLLETVASRALQQLSTLSDTGDSVALRQRATALREIANIQVEKGDRQSALVALRQAQGILHRLATAHPGDYDVAAEQGQVTFLFGEIAYQQGDVPGAVAHWQDYRAAAETMVAAKPASPDAWLELSYALNNLGSALEEEHKHEAAAGYFAESIALKRRVLVQRPGDQALLADIADSLSWLATAYQGMGRPAAAEPLYRQQIAALDHVLVRSKRAPLWVHRQAQARLWLADLDSALGRSDEVMAQLQQAGRDLDGLIRHDPARASWVQERALVHQSLAWQLALAGKYRQARAEASAALATLQPLLGKERSPGLATREAMAHRLLALLAGARGDLKSASQEARRAVDEMEALYSRKPENASLPNNLAEAWICLGEVRARQGFEKDARSYWMRAVDLLSRRAAGSHDRELLTPLVQSLEDLGRDAEAAPYRKELAAQGFRIQRLIDPSTFRKHL